jgi:ArsR family transcriptional regulator, arsenate/arsenite/antimonite-responsive transcriptional repressor
VKSTLKLATRAVDCCPPGGGDSAMARDRWPWIADDARVLKALADETRLGIVLQLRAAGELPQNDLVACCALAQPTVSHHLRILRETGVVAAEKRGVWTYYRLNPDALACLRRYLP